MIRVGVARLYCPCPLTVALTMENGSATRHFSEFIKLDYNAEEKKNIRIHYVASAGLTTVTIFRSKNQ
jgi:hypothetical protein